jgi:hypothetical protein
VKRCVAARLAVSVAWFVLDGQGHGLTFFSLVKPLATAWPIDGPVRPADICASIYHCLGMDPDTVIHDRLHRPHKIAQGGEPIHRILL